MDSWHVPAGVAEYYQWMNLPDADTSVSVLGRTLVSQRGLPWRTIEQQWPQVKSSIDSGQPAALGLVTVASANPGMLGHNHQVLAYAYQLAGPAVTLRVYDPNTGPADDCAHPVQRLCTSDRHDLPPQHQHRLASARLLPDGLRACAPAERCQTR